MNKIVLNLDIIKRCLNKEELSLYQQLNKECQKNNIDLKEIITTVLKNGSNIFNSQTGDFIEMKMDKLLSKLNQGKLKNEIKFMTKLMNSYLKDKDMMSYN